MIELPPKPAIIIPKPKDLVRPNRLIRPGIAVRDARKGVFAPGFLFGSPVGGDAYTSLLLHCNGADGSTTFTDVSAQGLSVSAGGTAQVDTAQSKFGGASLLLDGNSDYLLVTDNGSLDFGTGDFTVDLWIRPSSTLTTGTFALIGGRGSTNGDWSLTIYNQQLSLSTSYVAWMLQATASTWTAGQWYHVAVSRSGTSLKLFIDGVNVASTTNSTSLNSLNSTVPIGACQQTTNSATLDRFFPGHMDEIRVSKGIARWTATFTPPTVPYS